MFRDDIFSDGYLRIRAQSAPWSAGVEFVVFKYDPNKPKELGLSKNGFIELKDKHVTPPEVIMCIKNKEAQTLMDDLWNCGLRPTEGTGSAGSLMAKELCI